MNPSKYIMSIHNYASTQPTMPTTPNKTKAKTKTIQIPSLCILRVDVSIKNKYICKVFDNLFGNTTNSLSESSKSSSASSCVVKRLDRVKKKDKITGTPFYVVFVHFNPFAQLCIQKKESPPAFDINTFVDKIKQGNKIKIKCDFLNTWIVCENNAVRLRNTPNLKTKKNKPSISDYIKEHMNESVLV